MSAIAALAYAMSTRAAGAAMKNPVGYVAPEHTYRLWLEYPNGDSTRIRVNAANLKAARKRGTDEGAIVRHVQRIS